MSSSIGIVGDWSAAHRNATHRCERWCAGHAAPGSYKCGSGRWLACAGCHGCRSPSGERCANWCHHNGKGVADPTAELCRVGSNITVSPCSGCSFCALAEQTAYATIVYGTNTTHGATAAYSAVALGRAIQSLDPARPRVVVIDSSVSHEMRTLLSGDGLWSVFESAHPLNNAGRKNVLWTLPYRRVFFMDADIFPIQGVGESRSARAKRQRRLDGLWQYRGRLLSTRDMQARNNQSFCLNSGLMLLEPNPAVAFRLDAAATIQRQWEEAGHTGMHHKYPTGHIFERCPFGHDQPPLNAVFKGEWSGFRTAKLLLGPNMKQYCTEGGHTVNGIGRFYRKHTFYHAWSESMPLDLGANCSVSGLATRGCALKKEMDEEGLCQGVHNQYAHEWWAAFNLSVDPWIKSGE